MNGSEVSRYKRVEDTLQILQRHLYSLEQEAQVNRPKSEWEDRFRSDAGRIRGVFRDLEAVLNHYNMVSGKVEKYLAELKTYEDKLQSVGDQYRGEAEKIAGEMEKMAKTLETYVRALEGRYIMQQRKQEAQRIKKLKESAGATGTLATVAIILLSTLGLASFLYVQTEPTARVVSPTVANLPLGIAFLAILVIGIIAMPRLRR